MLNQRNVFLLDGTGAAVSAVFSGLILPLLQPLTGIPPWCSNGLAFLAVTYAVFSLSCWKRANPIRPWMLKTVIAANSFYCMISAAVAICIVDVTGLGRLLLAGEVFIVAVVIAIELKVLRGLVRPPLSHRQSAPKRDST